MVHGMPPPLIPRRGAWLCAPVSPCGTPTIVLKVSIQCGPAETAVDPARAAAATASTRVARNARILRIVRLLSEGRSCNRRARVDRRGTGPVYGRQQQADRRDGLVAPTTHVACRQGPTVGRGKGVRPPRGGEGGQNTPPGGPAWP